MPIVSVKAARCPAAGASDAAWARWAKSPRRGSAWGLLVLHAREQWSAGQFRGHGL